MRPTACEEMLTVEAEAKVSAPKTPSLPIPQRIGASHYEEKAVLKSLRPIEQGLRARLRSIVHDARNVLHIYADLFPDVDKALPLYGNARAGSWYVPPYVSGQKTKTCSFKSADGHYGQWSSSMRRPNVHVLQDCLAHGGVVLVDVTRRGKRWPDSFAKTVPIWCAVINTVAGLVKCNCTQNDETVKLQNLCRKCVPLHLHPDVVDSEKEQILSRLPHWVQEWQNSLLSLHQIVPAFSEVRRRKMKPLRSLWVNSDSRTWVNGLPLMDLDFTPIVCVSASRVIPSGNRSFVEPTTNLERICDVTFVECQAGFPYMQGAGDDEETWSFGLTPALMWKHRDTLMAIADSTSQGCTAAKVEEMLACEIERLTTAKHSPKQLKPEVIGSLVSYARLWDTRVSLTCTLGESVYEIIKHAKHAFSTLIVLGASRPQEGGEEEEAWGKVTTVKGNAANQVSTAWFPLRNRKGKVDYKYGFGRALGPCLSLLRDCCVDRRREALVCCTSKNGDWSAGLAIAWLAWHCQLSSSDARDMEGKNGFYQNSCGYRLIDERKADLGEISKTYIHNVMLHFISAYPQFQLSRPTLKQLNRFFSSPDPSSSLSER